MFKQFGVGAPGEFFGQPHAANVSIAWSGQLDELVAPDQLGSRRSFARDEEIYAEGVARIAGSRSFPAPRASAS